MCLRSVPERKRSQGVGGGVVTGKSVAGDEIKPNEKVPGCRGEDAGDKVRHALPPYALGLVGCYATTARANLCDAESFKFH